MHKLVGHVRNAPRVTTGKWRTAKSGAGPAAVCPDEVADVIRALGSGLGYAGSNPAASTPLPAFCTHAPAFDAPALTRVRNACMDELGALPRDSAHGLQRMRLQALRDHARLGLQHVRVAQSQQRWCKRLGSMAVPGASCRTVASASTRLGVGPAFGGVGATAGITLHSHVGSQSACFETLEYGQGRHRGIGVSVSADARLVDGLAATAGIAVSQEHTRLAGAASVEEYAAFRARRSIATPLRSRIGHRMRRLVMGADPEPADRVALAAQAALRWAPLLPALSRREGVGPAALLPLQGAALLPSAAPLLDVRLRSRVTSVQTRVAAGFGSSTATLSRSRLRVDLDVPMWLPDVPLDGAQREATARHLRERIAVGLAAKASRFPALDAAGGAAPQVRHDALRQLASEFQCLQALMLERQRGVDRRQLSHVLARTCADWNCSGAQQALVRMLDLATWLWLVLPPDRRDAAAALATALRTSPVLDQHPAAIRPLYAHQALQQRIDASDMALDVATSSSIFDTGQASASLRVTRSDQRNYNPLRDGTYVEASVTLRGALDSDALLAMLQTRLPEARLAGHAGELRRALHDAGNLQLAGTAAAMLSIRLFKPSFQDEPLFPEHARGLHLQQVTVRAIVTSASGGELPVTGIPLTTLTLGARLEHARQAALCPDLFCSATLTGALLRYQSLVGQKRDPGQAWQKMLTDHRGSLRRLAEALGQSHSSARAEALHWLRRRPGDPGHGHGCACRDCCNTRQDPLARVDQREEQLEGLQGLFDALLPLLAQAKDQSPLCHPVALGGMELRATRL